jgi:hypothetical protein
MFDIRAAIRDFSLREAEGPDRELIIALYEAFDEHNARFWDSALNPVPILITPPTSPKAFADASEFSGFGCRQQLRMRPACARGVFPIGAYGAAPKPGWRMLPGHPFEDRLRWLSDVVLHEMVHLWLNQIEHPDRHDHQGHGKPFCAECNRIGAMVSPPFPNVVPRRRKGDASSLPIGAQWPHNVRPGGEHGPYYGLLWELIQGEEELDDGGFAALYGAHDKATAEAIAKFQERYGYVSIATRRETAPESPRTPEPDTTVTISFDEQQALSSPPAALPSPSPESRLKAKRSRKLKAQPAADVIIINDDEQTGLSPPIEAVTEPGPEPVIANGDTKGVIDGIMLRAIGHAPVAIARQIAKVTRLDEKRLRKLFQGRAFDEAGLAETDLPAIEAAAAKLYPESQAA